MLPRIFTSLAAMGLVTLPLAAQEREVVVFVHGGTESAIENLDSQGTADFNTGFSVGGGLAWRFHRYVAVRGDFTFARNQADAPGMNFNDQDFNRFIYGGDLMFFVPMARDRIEPYAFGGIGGVTIDPEYSSSIPVLEPDPFTKVSARFGAGVQFAFPGTGLGVFAEGLGLVYSFDQMGYDRTQFDILANIGLSYGIPLP